MTQSTSAAASARAPSGLWAASMRIVGEVRTRSSRPGEEAAAKLDRAPTLVVASVIESGDPVQDEEDHAAAAVAAYIVLLAAHARGLAGYWRTPEVLRTAGGCSAAGVPEGERAIGLLHLGHPRQEKEPPERLPPGDFVTYLP